MRAGSLRLTRALLRCGLAAGPLFFGVATAEGLRRPGYQAVRHPISSLAIGPRGWVQVANSSASGALCLAFAAGLARADPEDGTAAASSLIALTAGGMLACAPFTADPVNGYPSGTPPTPETMTRAGLAHLIASSAIMIGVPATTAIHGWRAHRRGQRGWAGFSAVTTGVTMASFAGACAGFAQVSVLPRVAGALQRTAVAGGFVWLAALAARTLRSRLS